MGRYALRIHTDGATVDDFGVPNSTAPGWTLDEARERTEYIANHGVWVDESKFYPANRIVYVEVRALDQILPLLRSGS